MIQPGTHATPRADLGVAFHEYSLTRVRLVADLILPRLGVAKQASTIKVTKRKNMRIPNVDHANGAAYKRAHLYMDDLSYETSDYGLEGQLTDMDRENYANDFDGEVETINGVKSKILLAREKRISDAIFNTTTWDTSTAALYTDNSSSPWDSVDTNIISQVAAAKELVRTNTGVLADSLIIGEATMQNMLKNTGIIARFPGAAIITEEMIRAQLAAIFGLQQLIVGSASYNSADEGQDASMSDLWPDDYAMVAALGREGMPMTEPQLGRTIVWENYIPDVAYIEEYREEQTKSDIFRVIENLQEKIFDQYFAHLMLIDA